MREVATPATHLDDHSVRRRRHNALCAVLHEWARVELGATALRGNTPLAALGGALDTALRKGGGTGAGLSAALSASLRGKSRRPDLVALVPANRLSVQPGSAQPAGPEACRGRQPLEGGPEREGWAELLIVEVTVCREHALAARIADKRAKYADATRALSAALAPYSVRVAESVLVVGLGEHGTAPAGLHAELVRVARASRCADPDGAVDVLLGQLGDLVRAEALGADGLPPTPQSPAVVNSK